MKAHSESCAGPAGQPFLTPQIVAVGRKKELACIGQAKPGSVAVMGCRDPLLTLVFGAFAHDRRQTAAEGAVLADFDRVRVAHYQRRVRRTRPRDARPARFGSSICAAID